ncbi:MAG: hypothetical protein KC733_11805, partial [Candidatus Omnitrophica bacterium]|nr:hypothetical protein [Candidatus Omnitrophota bacterium]
MNPFAIPTAVTSLLAIYIAGIVYTHHKKTKANIIFSLFCLSLSFWLIGFTMMYLSTSAEQALVWARIGFSAILFIPILGHHFVTAFLKLNRKRLFTTLYLIAIPSIFIGWTDLIYKDIHLFFWGYYPRAGRFYILFLFMFFTLFSLNLIELQKAIRQSKQAGDHQLTKQYRYVFFAYLCGTTGVMDYIIKFGYEIYPFGYISALLFIFIIAYSIIKHQL